MPTDTTLKAKGKAGAPEDATPKALMPSPAPKEPSPGKDGTYSQQEVDKLLNLTKMEAGRERKAAELERDNFKSQLGAKEAHLTTVQDELTNLEKRIEELSSSDPELNNLEKRAKQLREQERKLKTDTATLEAEKQKHSQTLTEIQEIQQAVTVWNIAEMYSGGDEDKQAIIADKLIDLAKSLGATSEEKIQKIAETLYGETGLPEEPQKPFAGRQSGGDTFVRDSNNPTETLKQAFRKLKQRT